MNRILRRTEGMAAITIMAGALVLAIAYAVPANAQQEHYSNYYEPGNHCVFDELGGIGQWLCDGPGPQNTTTKFVAIAISKSMPQTTGSAWGFSSRQAAEQRALLECRNRAKDCEIVAWAYNNCIALAVSPDGAWGVAWDSYIDFAEAKALKECNSVGSKCLVRIHPCSGD